ncbi:MAG: glycosyltransferase family 2 protein [Pyrinomonadaceae bacterium]
MNRHPPTVSVVVLSYNRPTCLGEALASVLAQSYANLDVVVVDNASGASAEVERIVRRHARVRLLRNPTNVGFAAGMNRGIEAASGEYVFLTEDDIVLEADSVRLLVEYAEADASAGLLAPLILNREAGTVRCAGGEFVLGGVYRKEIHGAGAADAGLFPRPFDVTYVAGSSVFARTDFLRGVGGFREEFFMYVEDVELCARVIRAGRRITVVPSARVHHIEPAEETGLAPHLELQKLKNFFALYLLHAPRRVLPEFFLRYAVLGTLRAALGRGGNPWASLSASWWALRRARALRREGRLPARRAQDRSQTSRPFLYEQP